MCLSTAIALVISAVAASSANAQQSGWSRLGSSLGGMRQSQSDAYQQGINQGAEQAYMLESARAAHLENERFEAEQNWKSKLASLWQGSGLPPSEAASVAASFQLTNDLTPILERVKRQGMQQTVTDIWAAYHNYNYQLANELMVAAMISTSGTPPAR
jgi:hypothetical protein